MFSKIKNYISDNTGILIRIDDIAENMNWDLMEKSELLFEKYGIKPEDTPIFGMFEEIRKFLEKGGAGSHTPEVIRRIMSGYTGVLTEGIGALDKKIIAYNEAVKITRLGSRSNHRRT